MLESLGLGEAVGQDEADVIVFNTCTIRGEARSALRGAPRAGEGPEGRRSGQGDRRRRLLRGGTAGAALRPLSVRGRGLRSRLDPAPRRLDRCGRGGHRARTLRPRRPRVRGRAPNAPRARVPGVGPGLDGVQPKCSYCIVPSVRGREVSRRPGEIVAEVTGLAAEGVREAAPRAERQLLGPRPAPELRTEFGELLRACDQVDGIERIGLRARTEGLPRSGHRRARRCGIVCEHVHLPLQSGSRPPPEAMRRHVRPRAVPLAAGGQAARRDPRPRAGDGRDRRLPGRDRARLRGAARGGRGSPLRQRVHVHLLGEAGDGGPPRSTGSCRTSSSASVWSASSGSSSGSPASGTPSAWVEWRRCSSRAQARTDSRRLRGRTRRNTTVNFAGDARPGELVQVRDRGRDVDDAERTASRPRRRLTDTHSAHLVTHARVPPLYARKRVVGRGAPAEVRILRTRA